MPDPDFTIGQGDSAAVLTGIVLDQQEQPVNINGAALLLRVAPIGGGSLIVSGTAHVDQVGDGSDGTRGDWSYEWKTGETDVPGFYLGQLEVTFQGGLTQTFPEPGFMLIKIEDQLPLAPAYITREELKLSREMTGYAFEDHEIDIAIGAASRVIDDATGRRYFADAVATNERLYSARSWRRVEIDDLIELTSLEVDRDGDGDYEEVWSADRYLLNPANAPADGKPWDEIAVRTESGWTFPLGANRIRVTGKFGWKAVPPELKMAASILAQRYVLRLRQAPFGIVSAGMESGALMRIARNDPDVAPVLDTFTRKTPFI